MTGQFANWNALENAISGHEMCLRQKYLQRNVAFTVETLPDEMCWGMLPLITECVRGKSSSSALLEFTIEMLPNENTLVNATSGYGICLRQEWLQWLQRLVENHCQHVAKWVRWGMLPLTTKCV